MQYHKIQSLFFRDRSTNKLMLDQWSRPEFGLLKDMQWEWTEKVDGMNMRIIWDGETGQFRIAGKTDNANIPPALYDRMLRLVDEVGGDFIIACDSRPFTIYGEGYGGKIQKGSKYSTEMDFVMFDVRIHDAWMERDFVRDLGAITGIPVAPVVGSGTIDEAIQCVKGGLKSRWGDFNAEGLVIRPPVELKNKWGERVIAKVKEVDYCLPSGKEMHVQPNRS